MMGTPLYMSPEQVRNERTIGPAADVYALGHIAYTLLVGESYWAEEAEDIPSPYLLIAEIMRGAIDLPSARAARRRDVSLPAAFDPWFSRVTSLAPENRFARATEAIEALASALSVPLPRPTSFIFDAITPAPSPCPPAGEPDQTTADPVPASPEITTEGQKGQKASAVSTVATHQSGVSEVAPERQITGVEAYTARGAMGAVAAGGGAGRAPLQAQLATSTVARDKIPPRTVGRDRPSSPTIGRDKTPAASTTMPRDKTPSPSQPRERASTPPRKEYRFEITTDLVRRILRLKVWGFWTVDEAQAYWEAFQYRVRPLLAGPWYVLADISNFGPQKDDVNAIVAKTMDFARENGMVRAANLVLVDAALAKMLIARLSAATGLPAFSFFTSEDKAVAWLLQGSPGVTPG